MTTTNGAPQEDYKLDVIQRLISLNDDNRHLAQENEKLRREVRVLRKDIAYWQDVARSARGVTRTYMKVGENLIQERAGLEAKIDKLQEQVDNEYCVSVSEDLK